MTLRGPEEWRIAIMVHQGKNVHIKETSTPWEKRGNIVRQAINGRLVEYGLALG